MKVTLGQKTPAPIIDESPLTEDERGVLYIPYAFRFDLSFTYIKNCLSIPESRLRSILFKLVKRGLLDRNLGRYSITVRGNTEIEKY